MIGRFRSVAKALECKRPLYRFMIHKVLEQFYIRTLSREKHWSRHLQFKRHKIKDRSRHCLSYKKITDRRLTKTCMIQHLKWQMLNIGTWLSDLLSSSLVLHYFVQEQLAPPPLLQPIQSHPLCPRHMTISALLIGRKFWSSNRLRTLLLTASARL